MMTGRVTAGALAIVVVCVFGSYAQDFNHVPGWSNTTNHRYKGGAGTGEWAEKEELFGTLGALGPDAECTLRNLSEQDGNVIVNRYRRQLRRAGEQSALQEAQRELAAHYQQLNAQGRC